MDQSEPEQASDEFGWRHGRWLWGSRCGGQWPSKRWNGHAGLGPGGGRRLRANDGGSRLPTSDASSGAAAFGLIPANEHESIVQPDGRANGRRHATAAKYGHDGNEYDELTVTAAKYDGQ